MKNMKKIERESFVPLYQQLEDYLSSKIRDEKLKPGDALPSESELAAQFGVSRITVRQAMARLEFEGLIERRQGKGTFVSRPRFLHRDLLVRALEDEIQAEGRSPGFYFISYTELDPPPKVQEQLRSSPGERVFCLKRLKLLDGEPWAIETRYLPGRVGKALEKSALESLPIYQLLETVLGRFPKQLKETIGCSVAWEEEAKSLQIPVGHPVLVGEHAMFDDAGTPVECGKTIFRGDRYQVYVEFWRNP